MSDSINQDHILYCEKLTNAANDFDLIKMATLCRALAERKELARSILDLGGLNEEQSKYLFHYHNENIKKILGI